MTANIYSSFIFHKQYKNIAMGFMFLRAQVSNMDA